MVMLAVNDPLNEKGAVERLAQRSFSAQVTLLPCGGHLGYWEARWTRWKLGSIFGTFLADRPGGGDRKGNEGCARGVDEIGGGTGAVTFPGAATLVPPPLDLAVHFKGT